MRHEIWRWVGCLLLGALPGRANDAEFFEKRIRPVLADACFKCHSSDAKKLKANLHVDSRRGLMNGGDSGAAIVPGDPDASRLIKAVEYHDVDLQMPPRKKLSDQQIADLRIWVKNGAIWPGSDVPEHDGKKDVFDLAARKAAFWAWQPIGKPNPPVNLSDAWPRDQVDHFIRARLKEKGLQPMVDAERVTLIRRASFDLTGLTPTPAEVDAFVKDRSPDAFAKVVDRLLKSERFGERWARHWLDMVRYSETLGHEFDYPIQNAWRYRDYAIRAFNDDLPFDQFMREHVAGDLLPKPRMENGVNQSIIGTSFYWFGQQKHSPVDIRQETADTIDNQIDVLTKTFLGMTVSCARCHDHKFDAISTRDYYALFGVLGSSRYAQRSIDEGTIGEAVKKLTRLHREIADELESQRSPELKRVRGYLTAALELQRHAEPDGGEVVFEDFESGSFEGWTTTGDAFAGGPRTQQTVGGYQGDIGAQGKFFVNSHNITRDGEHVRGDGFTGTLTSPEFVIRKHYIHFLIGGGFHVKQTCVNLLVDGEVVDSKAGPGNNRMRPASFDVSAYQGRKARIQAVDEVHGGWGNIGLDHIVFSDRRAGEEGRAGMPSDARIASVARKHGLDGDTLKNWLHALEALKDLKRPVEDSMPEGTVFADFAKKDDWFREGAALSVRNGRSISLREGSVLLREPGWVSSDTLGRRVQGAFRSPTFPVDMEYIHLLVAGEGTRINAVVDNFTIIKNPIWGGLKMEIKNAEAHWVRLDMRMAKGRRAWLELLDESNGDPGGKASYPADAWFAVRKVVFSNDARAPRVSVRHPLAFGISDLNAKRVESLAVAVEKGTDVSVLNWLAKHALLATRETSSKMRHAHEIARSLPDLQRVPSMAEGRAHNERVFIRGGHRNLGDLVPRRFLEAIQGSGEGFDTESSGRMEVADWLVDERNPLPARVMANKVWHHLFGRGIVGTVDNLGVLGERPTHPELLDYLAWWYRENGWSTKALIRKLMLSRAYQMGSGTQDLEAETKDPDNRLLHRANVKRLEGEALRDSIMAIAGTLTDKMYGDSVPVHLTAFMEGRGKPRSSGPLDGDGRRSIYVEVRRNFLSPMMTAFDTPPPATTVGRRPISNVPAQALIMMNDPFVVDQCKKWAGKLTKEHSLDGRLVGEMYRRLFGRPADGNEKRAALSFLSQQNDPKQAVADLAHVLFNVKEFMFVN